jgi:DNA ligase D-like protein (predicted 3'-phosphoesterase)
MSSSSEPGAAAKALRVSVRGRVQGVGLRDSVRRRALELGVMGWVRNSEDGEVLIHAEAPGAALDRFVEFLRDGPALARVEGVAIDPVSLEGHEQFAIRGVSAGRFVVREHAATSRHFDLRLELDGEMRSWALPKGPSMDPAVSRLAIDTGVRALTASLSEGARAIVWDRGGYEQGGRVPWPAAIERGHAVFVLHGEKLRGGFALQRTSNDAKAQWLLIKRRDAEAQRGSDVVTEQPRSVTSGLTLDELLG